MDSVHGWWTTAGSHGLPWTSGGLDRRALGCGGALTKVGPPAALKHGSSPAVLKKGLRSTGVPSRASPRLGRWCGGRVAAEEKLGGDGAQAQREGENRRDGYGENQRCGLHL
jgi:hypothetical protein